MIGKLLSMIIYNVVYTIGKEENPLLMNKRNFLLFIIVYGIVIKNINRKCERLQLSSL